MSQPKILFKTKGGYREGIGDVVSSLNIADEFRRHGQEVLFVINNNQSVIRLVSQKKFKFRIVENLFELNKYISEQVIDITILNQLDTPEDEGVMLRRYSKMLITVDDTGKSAALSDLRFNVLYPIEDSFCDFQYIALSSAFQQKHNIPKGIKKQVETILVTQGGSDTYGLTSKIIRALYNIPPDINIEVIIGPEYSHYQELEDVIHKSPRTFDIIKGTEDLSDLMLQSDLAISAGGNTLFELACLGVPTIVVCGELFEVETANRLQDKGFGKSLGFGKYVDEKDIYCETKSLTFNTNARAKMSVVGKRLIDGLGTKRIVDIVIESFGNRYDFCKTHRPL